MQKWIRRQKRTIFVAILVVVVTLWLAPRHRNVTPPTTAARLLTRDCATEKSEFVFILYGHNGEAGDASARRELQAAVAELAVALGGGGVPDAAPHQLPSVRLILDRITATSMGWRATQAMPADEAGSLVASPALVDGQLAAMAASVTRLTLTIVETCVVPTDESVSAGERYRAAFQCKAAALSRHLFPPHSLGEDSCRVFMDGDVFVPPTTNLLLLFDALRLGDVAGVRAAAVEGRRVGGGGPDGMLVSQLNTGVIAVRDTPAVRSFLLEFGREDELDEQQRFTSLLWRHGISTHFLPDWWNCRCSKERLVRGNVPRVAIPGMSRSLSYGDATKEDGATMNSVPCMLVHCHGSHAVLGNLPTLP